MKVTYFIIKKPPDKSACYAIQYRLADRYGRATLQQHVLSSYKPQVPRDVLPQTHVTFIHPSRLQLLWSATGSMNARPSVTGR